MAAHYESTPSHNDDDKTTIDEGDDGTALRSGVGASSGSISSLDLGYDRISLFCIAFGYFVGTVEYGIIMPSVWNYLLSLGLPTSDEYFMGLVLGSFSLSQMITAPFFGSWVDKHTMKPAIIASFVFGVIGSILYALALNPWMILTSRLICGIGANLGVVGSTYIIRTVASEERSGLFAGVSAFANLGMLLGPAVNLVLVQIKDVKLFYRFTLTSYSSPGWVMVVLNIYCIYLALLLFKEPPLPKHDHHDPEDEVTKTGDESWRQTLREWWAPYRSLLNEVTGILCFANFIFMFNQTTLETILTPLSKIVYDWQTLQNSYFYASMTVGFVIMFMIIQFLSDKLKIEDRILFFVGHVFQGAGFALMLAYYQYSSTWHPHFIVFLMPTILLTIGLPFAWALISSMFSKHVPEERQQGLGQGLLNATSSLAAILGPYWSGFSLEVNAKLTFGLLVGFWVLLTIPLIYIYPKLKTEEGSSSGSLPQEQKQTQKKNHPGDVESEPLLGSINN
eukprot:TRINITY_DN10947_c0_g1_i1.p1 TRINITY_DN10947_c0_g1~~TRINITY_DN10947_c0_g1_i1.p1  ORF type:complete len:507 (-),score=99.96 TRINITY_DN10947_c0_g1_i1:151-1671(-)